MLEGLRRERNKLERSLGLLLPARLTLAAESGLVVIAAVAQMRAIAHGMVHNSGWRRSTFHRMGFVAAALIVTASSCLGQATVESVRDPADSPEEGCQVLQGTTTYK